MLSIPGGDRWRRARSRQEKRVPRISPANLSSSSWASLMCRERQTRSGPTNRIYATPNNPLRGFQVFYCCRFPGRLGGIQTLWTHHVVHYFSRVSWCASFRNYSKFCCRKLSTWVCLMSSSGLNQQWRCFMGSAIQLTSVATRASCLNVYSVLSVVFNTLAETRQRVYPDRSLRQSRLQVSFNKKNSPIVYQVFERR